MKAHFDRLLLQVMASVRKMGYLTVIHGAFILPLCLLSKQYSLQATLFGVFYDNGYQTVLNTSSKELNTTSKSSIIRRDFGLHQFMYQIEKIGEDIATAGGDKSFLFTDASSLGKEIMKEVVKARSELVSKGRRMIFVDNAFSGEAQVSNILIASKIYRIPLLYKKLQNEGSK